GAEHRDLPAGGPVLPSRPGRPHRGTSAEPRGDRPRSRALGGGRPVRSGQGHPGPARDRRGRELAVARSGSGRAAVPGSELMKAVTALRTTACVLVACAAPAISWGQDGAPAPD